jgi:hypothetical protein
MEGFAGVFGDGGAADMDMPGIGGIGADVEEADGAGPGPGLPVPMSIPGMLIAMFCMAAIKFVSESIRN